MALSGGAGRRLLPGLQLLAATALVLGLLAGTNLLARKPTLRARLDLSPGAAFSLSPETRRQALDLLRALGQEVRIEAFFSPPLQAEPGHPEKARVDNEGAIRLRLQESVRRLLAVYEAESAGRIRVRIYDLAREIQEASLAVQRLGLKERLNPYEDVVVVAAGQRREILSTWRDMAVVRIPEVPLGGTQGPPRLEEFTGEEALSTRIRSVCLARSPKVRFLVGHGETHPDAKGEAGLELLMGLLRQEGCELDVLDLRREGRVPAECDLVIVVQPQAALAAAEEEELRGWVARRGGRLLAVHGFHEAYTVDLSPLLGPVGLAHGSRPVLAMTLDRNVTGVPVLTGDERALVTTLYRLASGHPITAPLARSRGWLEVANCLPVTVAPAARLPAGVACQELATTEPICWEGGPAGPGADRYLPPPGVPARSHFHIAAAGQVAGEGGRPGRVVFLGSSEAILTFYLRQFPANRDFLANAVNWLVDRSERVAVTPRSALTRRLPPITPQQGQRLRWVALGAFPGAVLLAGLVVFLRRRR